MSGFVEGGDQELIAEINKRFLIKQKEIGLSSILTQSEKAQLLARLEESKNEEIAGIPYCLF